MQVVLNGKNIEIEAITGTSMVELLKQCGYDQNSIAIAVNGEFLPRHKWQEHLVQSNESIELIAPMQGG